MALADFFLKLDSITGESTDSKHKGEIQLESWSWGEQNSASFSASVSGGGGSGKVKMGDFNFVKQIDQSDTALAQACATGQHIASATLTCRKAGGTQLEYLIIKFTDVLVSSYEISGTGSADILPQTSIGLNFAAISATYVSQKADGTAGAQFKWGYNLKTQAVAA